MNWHHQMDTWQEPKDMLRLKTRETREKYKTCDLSETCELSHNQRELDARCFCSEKKLSYLIDCGCCGFCRCGCGCNCCPLNNHNTASWFHNEREVDVVELSSCVRGLSGCVSHSGSCSVQIQLFLHKLLRKTKRQVRAAIHGKFLLYIIEKS